MTSRAPSGRFVAWRRAGWPSWSRATSRRRGSQSLAAISAWETASASPPNGDPGQGCSCGSSPTVRGYGTCRDRAFLIDPGKHRPTGRLDEGSSTRNRKVVGSNPTSGAHRSSSGLERWLASLRGGWPSGHRGARWLAGRGRHRRHHQSREAAPPRPDGPSPRAACSLSSDVDCFASGLPEPSPACGWGGAGLSHGKVLPCLESRTPEPRRMP
jgi:hypothetical protein